MSLFHLRMNKVGRTIYMYKATIKQLERRLKKMDEQNELPISFYDCYLDEKCPYWIAEGEFAPDNLLIVDGRCQHKLIEDGLKPENRYQKFIFRILDMDGNLLE
jgi:translation elongation factor EF-G